MVHGALSLALSSVRTTETHVERVLSLQFRDQSLKRSLVHLHFPTWPELCVCRPGWWSGGDVGSDWVWLRAPIPRQRPARQPRPPAALHPGGAHPLPASAPAAHARRRPLQVGAGSLRAPRGPGAGLTSSSGRSSGVGRTGAFALLYAAVQEVEAGSGIPQLPQLVRRMRQQRKHMLQEKVRLSGQACALPPGDSPQLTSRVPPQLHLKFCHEAVVRHVEQVLQRHGVPPPSKPTAGTGIAQKVRGAPPRGSEHLMHPLHPFLSPQK